MRGLFTAGRGRFLLCRFAPSSHPSLPLRLAHRSLSIAAPAAQTAPQTLSEAHFHNLADRTLQNLELSVTSLEDSVDGFDMSYAMGVLTVRLGGKGTYVLNKQTPNRQIWWSSPVSGPRRYAWDAGSGHWVNTRDGHNMLEALEGELEELLGVRLRLSGGTK